MQNAHEMMLIMPCKETVKNGNSVGKNVSLNTHWSLLCETCSFMMPDSSVSMSR